MNWRAVSDASFESSSVGAIAVSESNPDIVYVGMGETQLRGNILQGDGSTRPSTRTHLDPHRPGEAQAIGRIRVTPPTPNRLRRRARRSVWVTPIAACSNPSTAGRPGPEVFFATTNRCGGSLDGAKSPDVLYAGCGKCSARRTTVERWTGERPVQVH